MASQLVTLASWGVCGTDITEALAGLGLELAALRSVTNEEPILVLGSGRLWGGSVKLLCPRLLQLRMILAPPPTGVNPG